MRQRLKGLAGAGAALAPLLWLGLAQAAGHAGCQDCHAAGTPSADNLRQALSGLCIDCHQGRVEQGEHVVDIPVTGTAISLPLQGGVMTCITCHDPHATGLALRQPDPQLCRNCHRR